MTNKIEVYVLVCEHKHGVDVHLHMTESEVKKTIEEWREDWEDSLGHWEYYTKTLEVKL